MAPPSRPLRRSTSPPPPERTAARVPPSSSPRGTRGLADHCAPTKGPGFQGQIAPLMSSMGINYELPYYAKFRARGMRLVLTDYIGLGTPGVHT